MRYVPFSFTSLYKQTSSSLGMPMTRNTNDIFFYIFKISENYKIFINI